MRKDWNRNREKGVSILEIGWETGVDRKDIEKCKRGCRQREEEGKVDKEGEEEKRQ